MAIVLPTTLCLTAAALVLNFWLAMRIGKLRQVHQVSVGDGGNEHLLRRMRAQANFHEMVPLTLILFGLVEAAGRGGVWLAPLGAVFLLGRIAHAFGMESADGFKAGRPLGMLICLITQLTLMVFAVLISLGKA
jgi:uncharacterized membrane protein YecN with MAPEG domain